MGLVSEAALWVKASQEKEQDTTHPPKVWQETQGPEEAKQFPYNEMKLVHSTLPVIFHPRNMSTQNVRSVLGLSS